MVNKIILKTIIKELEKWAPLKWAHNWDNSGLQIGGLHQEIKKILLAVDIDAKVLAKIKKQKFDLVITHHPLLFKPIKQIDFSDSTGEIISTLIKNNTACYAMHTNLDIAPDGVNDALIKAFGYDPAKGKLIRPIPKDIWCKLFVYVPKDNLEEFRVKVFKQFPSHIGNYASCSFATAGQGTFRPLKGADPYIGKVGDLEYVNEEKLEFLIKKEEISQAIDFIRQNHPYEEPAFDIYEECFALKKLGQAKYFLNKEGMSLKDLLKKYPCQIKGQKKKDKINKIAFACGSGGYLVDDLIKAEIDILVTGEIGYHEQLNCELNNIAVIELGHKESEEFVLPEIKKYLEKLFVYLQVEY